MVGGNRSRKGGGHQLIFLVVAIIVLLIYSLVMTGCYVSRCNDLHDREKEALGRGHAVMTRDKFGNVIFQWVDPPEEVVECQSTSEQ